MDKQWFWDQNRKYSVVLKQYISKPGHTVLMSWTRELLARNTSSLA